jgi:hypothetical protein
MIIKPKMTTVINRHINCRNQINISECVIIAIKSTINGGGFPPIELKLAHSFVALDLLILIAYSDSPPHTFVPSFVYCPSCLHTQSHPIPYSIPYFISSHPRYRLVTEEEYEAIRVSGGFVYEGEEKGLFGFTAPVSKLAVYGVYKYIIVYAIYSRAYSQEITLGFDNRPTKCADCILYSIPYL